MKRIKLTQGKYALIDNEDFELVSKYKWTVDSYGYATAWQYSTITQNTKFTSMVKIIMPPYNTKKLKCDHIDGNILNNQKSNLRLCTHRENLRNRKKPKNNTSGFKGVRIRHKKYEARIGFNYKEIHLGTYKTIHEAANAYNKAAIKYYGQFANLNKL